MPVEGPVEGPTGGPISSGGRRLGGIALTLLAAAVTVTALPSADVSVASPTDRALEEAAESVDAHTRAVEEAIEALERTETRLEEASAAAEEATARVKEVRKDAEEARRTFEQAKRAEELAESELDDVVRQIDRSREQAGAVAGAAYRAGGALANWSLLLETDNPSEFTDTYVDTRTLLRAGDAVLHDLTQQQGELAELTDRLEVLQDDRREKAAAAAAALEEAEQAAESAREAEQRLAASRAAQVTAVEEAERAKEEDHRRYQELLAASESVSERLASTSGNSRTATVSTTGSGTFVRPGTGSVTSSFGSRMHPILGYVKQHTGTDLAPGDGYIYAADSGVVAEARWDNAYGNMVVVDHGVIDGSHVATLYAHQAGLSVSEGETVGRGQPIGTVGSTGYSTGPHLHFEVRVNGTPVDPWPWIADAPMP